MNNTRVKALGVAALAVVAALTGCAQQTGSPTAALTGPELLADTIDKVYGTVQQRQAGQERQFYALHAAIAACAAGKGFEYIVPAYTPVPVERVIGPGELLAFSPRRTDFGVAEAITALAKTGDRESPSKANLTGPAREAWIGKYNACFEPAVQATDGMSAAIGSYALSARLADHLAKLQEDLAPGLPAAYNKCMTAEGTPAVELADVMTAAKQKYPPVVYDTPSDPTKVTGWDEAVAYERRLAAADWACRGTEATRVVNASSASLTTWADRERVALDAVAAAWAAMPTARDTARADASK